MNSLEMAKRFNKRHDNVKRTINTLAAKGLIAYPASEEVLTTGGPGTVYVLGERDSSVVVARLAPALAADDAMQFLSQSPSVFVKLTNTEGALTMSSLEMAELTETLHSNVKRTIDALAADELIAYPASEELPSTGGRPSIVYHIGKRDSFVVVARLSPAFTARLVDRWQELENSTAQPSHPQLGDIMTLLQDMRTEMLEDRNARMEAEGKVKALIGVDETHSLRAAAHACGVVGNPEWFTFLKSVNLLAYYINDNIPAQWALSTGYITGHGHNPGGSRSSEPRVTTTGLRYLKEMVRLYGDERELMFK